MSDFLRSAATFLAYLITFIIGFGVGILCTVLILG